MKFSIYAHDFLKKIKPVQNCIGGGSGLPAFEEFLFELKGNTLSVSVINKNAFATVHIEVEAPQGQDANCVAAVSVQHRKFIETLTLLKELKMTCTIDTDVFCLHMKTDTGNYKISGNNPDDYPKKTPIENPQTSVIPSFVFFKAVQTTSFAAATDEIRPALNGVFLEFNDREALFTATEGHKLSQYCYRNPSIVAMPHVIIPKEGFENIKKFFPTSGEGWPKEIKMEIGERHACFIFGESSIQCSLIASSYIDYKNFVPRDNPISVILNREEILKAVKRAKIYSPSDWGGVRFLLVGDQLIISSEDEDYGNKSIQTLNFIEHEGDDLDVFLSPKILIEILSHFSCESVKITMKGKTTLLTVSSSNEDEAKELFMLLAPMLEDKKAQVK